ncbi:MAG: hypothetical protein ABIZ80_01280, partial [Bryobacteraceae bacterium]
MKRNSTVWKIVAGLAAAGAVAFVPRVMQFAEAQRPAPAAASTSGANSATYRILLGVGDTAGAAWDGTIQAAGARIAGIEGWRFNAQDSTDGRSSWKASTRRAAPQTGAARRAGQQGPVFETGLLVDAVLSDPGAKFDVQTKQGNFSFTAQQVPMGDSQAFLDGKVVVDRSPSTLQLTDSPEEQDFPAIAQSGDDVYVAFVEFTHGDRAKVLPQMMDAAPANFDALTRPIGGDRVMLMHYSKSKNAWDAPVPISAPKQDVMRAAVAIDGARRVWVVWSANQNGNFDVYATTYAGGKAGSPQRLTSDAGTDVNPVAATDAKGRVWIAWQAFRNGSLDILAAVQQGDRFSKEFRVSFSPASDWDPAIAASANGEVAVSWDTYDKGDYDVYFRRLSAGGSGGIGMDAPVPVAASQNFEARSSIAFDAGNRLWVAYEASETKWGKDFGAYETTGVALYQGHTLKMKCFEGAKAFATADDLASAIPGPPQAGARRGRRRANSAAPQSVGLPNPALATNRAPSATPQVGPLPLNSFPRIATDSDGAVYLAFRMVGSSARSPTGSTWFENVSYFDGVEWKGPIFIPRTDGLLDNRPSLAAIAPGQLLLVSAMDHRQAAQPGARRRGGGDVVNTDLVAAQIRLDKRPESPKLVAIAAEAVTAPQSEVKSELEQVASLRNYRVNLGSQKFQLMRGEFHRHTEMSGDGGRDGPVIDAYRYMIDAAYMDWVGCCDHDNGGGREYNWWLQQKLTDAYKLGTKFVPMFSYERSVRYPEGHRNVVMPNRGVRPLPRIAKTDESSPSAPAPDTQMLYRYLHKFGGIVASHTSGTDMGTDWRDNDPIVEPVVEIYQGDRQNYEMPDAPRSNNDKDSIGGWRSLGFVSLALQKGYKLAFQASSDHISTHMSYCNLWVTTPTREGIMDAFRKRRVYGATENILADVRCAGHFMGEEFSVKEPPSISVKLAGTAP